MLNVALFLSLFFLNSLFVDGLSCLSLILKYPIVSHIVVVVFDWSKILSLLFEKALSVDTCQLASSSKEFCVYKWLALSYRIVDVFSFYCLSVSGYILFCFHFCFCLFSLVVIFVTVYLNDLTCPTQELSYYVLHCLFPFLYLPTGNYFPYS